MQWRQFPHWAFVVRALSHWINVLEKSWACSIVRTSISYNATSNQTPKYLPWHCLTALLHTAKVCNKSKIGLLEISLMFKNRENPHTSESPNGLIIHTEKRIDNINNKARYNLIDAKYRQMAFRSVPTTLLFGICSNKTDEDSDCIVRMLLFFSTKTYKWDQIVSS